MVWLGSVQHYDVEGDPLFWERETACGPDWRTEWYTHPDGIGPPAVSGDAGLDSGALDGGPPALDAAADGGTLDAVTRDDSATDAPATQ